MKVIELVEKQPQDEENTKLIAECNVYEGEVLVQQLSRSPFVFPNTMTDEEIIDSLWLNEYSIYA